MSSQRSSSPHSPSISNAPRTRKRHNSSQTPVPKRRKPEGPIGITVDTPSSPSVSRSDDSVTKGRSVSPRTRPAKSTEPKAPRGSSKSHERQVEKASAAVSKRSRKTTAAVNEDRIELEVSAEQLFDAICQKQKNSIAKSNRTHGNLAPTQGESSTPKFDPLREWFATLGLPCYPDKVKPSSADKASDSKRKAYVASTMDQETLKTYCGWVFESIKPSANVQYERSAAKAYQPKYRCPTDYYYKRINDRPKRKGTAIIHGKLSNHLLHEVYRILEPRDPATEPSTYPRLYIPSEWEKEAAVPSPRNQEPSFIHDAFILYAKKLKDLPFEEHELFVVTDSEGTNSDAGGSELGQTTPTMKEEFVLAADSDTEGSESGQKTPTLKARFILAAESDINVSKHGQIPPIMEQKLTLAADSDTENSESEQTTPTGKAMLILAAESDINVSWKGQMTTIMEPNLTLSANPDTYGSESGQMTPTVKATLNFEAIPEESSEGTQNGIVAGATDTISETERPQNDEAKVKTGKESTEMTGNLEDKNEAPKASGTQEKMDVKKRSIQEMAAQKHDFKRHVVDLLRKLDNQDLFLEYKDRKSIQDDDKATACGDITYNEDTTDIDQYPPAVIFNLWHLNRPNKPVRSEQQVDMTIGRFLKGVMAGGTVDDLYGKLLRFPPYLRPIGVSPKPDGFNRAVDEFGWEKSLLPVVYVSEGKTIATADLPKVQAQVAVAFHATLIILILYYLDTRKQCAAELPRWLFLYGIHYTESGVVVLGHHPRYDFEYDEGKGRWELCSRVLSTDYGDVFVGPQIERLRLLAVLIRIRSHSLFVLEQLKQWKRGPEILKVLSYDQAGQPGIEG